MEFIYVYAVQLHNDTRIRAFFFILPLSLFHIASRRRRRSRKQKRKKLSKIFCKLTVAVYIEWCLNFLFSHSLQDAHTHNSRFGIFTFLFFFVFMQWKLIEITFFQAATASEKLNLFRWNVSVSFSSSSSSSACGLFSSYSLSSWDDIETLKQKSEQRKKHFGRKENEGQIIGPSIFSLTLTSLQICV